MINNSIIKDFINSVYKVISDEVALRCYISPDKTKVMRVLNINFGTPEIRHFIYSKEDISLSNFLFRVDVYVLQDEPEECSHYVKWASIIEIWNENWKEISNEEFKEFRKKLEEKFEEFENGLEKF